MLASSVCQLCLDQPRTHCNQFICPVSQSVCMNAIFASSSPRLWTAYWRKLTCRKLLAWSVCFFRLRRKRRSGCLCGGHPRAEVCRRASQAVRLCHTAELIPLPAARGIRTGLPHEASARSIRTGLSHGAFARDFRTRLSHEASAQGFRTRHPNGASIRGHPRRPRCGAGEMVLTTCGQYRSCDRKENVHTGTCEDVPAVPHIYLDLFHLLINL